MLSYLTKHNFLFLFAFVLAMFCNSLMSTNPDHIAPILLDTLFIVVLTTAFFVSKNKSEKAQKSLNPSKTDLKIIISAFVLLIILTIRAFLANSSQSETNFSCSFAGGIIYQLDCLLFSSSTGQSSARVIIPHYFALITAILGGMLALKHGKQKLLFIAAFVGLSIYGIEELLARTTETIKLHEFLFGPRELNNYQTPAGPFTNIGWAWPFLAPVTAVSIWLSFSSQRKYKSTGIIMTIICVLLTVFNGQRGANVSLIFCLVAAFFFKLHLSYKSGIFKSIVAKKTTILLLVFFGLGTATCYFVYPNAGRMLNSETKDFYHKIFKKDPFSQSNSRIDIWKDAIKDWKEKPILGHGHASWMKQATENVQGNSARRPFESVHNLYLQLLVELGVVHALAILGLIFWIWNRIRQNLLKEEHGLLLLTCLTVMFVIGTVVQEIDYVRSTYYQWAFFIGVLSMQGIQNKQGKIKTKHLVALNFCSICAAAVYYVFFSSGLFAFEPLQKQVGWPNLERWGKSNFNLKHLNTSAKPASLLFQARLETGGSIANMRQNLTDGLNGMQSGEIFFVSLDQDKIGLNSAEISIDAARRIDSRIVSARIAYPPITSSSTVRWGRSIQTKAQDGELVISCNGKCFIGFLPCRAPTNKITFASSSNQTQIKSIQVTLSKNLSDIDSSSFADISPKVTTDLKYVSNEPVPINHLQIVYIEHTNENPVKISGLSCVE